MPDDYFIPQTPREALLEIRRLIAQSPKVNPQTISALAAEGLRGRAGYELPDVLADRLAEAHKLLREFREGTELAVLSGEVDEALALPPDLEAMIDRRMR